MGLDMYLYGQVYAPEASELAVLIDEALTETDRLSIKESGHVYVSGWNIDGTDMKPDCLYEPIGKAIRFESCADSPHYVVTPDESGGYYVKATVYYWRKANAIHRWFVENVQGGQDECEEFWVHPELILDLIERCQQIVERPREAPELLPTQGGFFFGPTEYGEWYLDEITATAVNLKKRLGALPPGVSLSYVSSW